MNSIQESLNTEQTCISMPCEDVCDFLYFCNLHRFYARKIEQNDKQIGLYAKVQNCYLVYLNGDKIMRLIKQI